LRWASRPARLLPSLQPKVFTQPNCSPAWSSGVLQDRLSRHRGHPGRRAQPARHHRLAKVPHWTTLQKASSRLLRSASVQRLLEPRWFVPGREDATGSAGPREAVAVDSSASRPITAATTSCVDAPRAKKTANVLYKRFPSWRSWPIAPTIWCCGDRPARTRPGHRAHRADRLPGLPARADGTLLADAGYDGEWVHEVMRQDLASAASSRQDRAADRQGPVGYYRRLMSSGCT